MLKKTLSVLALLAAGTGVALGQDASSSSYPAARLQSPAQNSVPAGRPSPYSNYQSTTMTADGVGAGAGVGAAPAPAGTAIAGAPTTGCASCASCGNSSAKCCLHGWFIGEYLMLFPNRMSVPTVLVDAAGAPLAGPSPDLGITHGFRINTGLWLCDGDIGMQSVILGTFRSYVTNTQPTGTIPLVAGGALLPVAVTAFTYQSWFQMDGGEGNSLLHIAGDEATRIYLLGGGRYLNVSDDVAMRYTIGAANFFDEFHTRNQFFGFQVGAMVTHCTGKLDLDFAAKVALGDQYTQLFILGSNTGATNVQAFTQSSNIGYYESNYFGVIPEFDANVGYRITERIGVRVGYTFIMDINMWRAGNQITTTFPPVVPANRSQFYVHGFNAGVTFRY